MSKKGEITINYIIMLIIGLIVLVVVLIVFRQQVGSFISTIGDLITGYGSEATKATEDLLP